MDPWDKMYLQMALVVATKSKDPSTKVGAVLVSPCKTEIAIGFNGFPASMQDEEDVLRKETGYVLQNNVVTTVPVGFAAVSKLDLVLHAEENAVLNCHKRPAGWSLYCTHIPCKNCARFLAGSGVSHIISLDQKGRTDLGYSSTALILALAGVTLTVIHPQSLQ